MLQPTCAFYFLRKCVTLRLQVSFALLQVFFLFSLNKRLLLFFHCLKYMLINIDHLGHAKASFTVPLTQGMNNISCCLSALDQEADFLSLFRMNLIGGILVNASVSSRGTWIAFSLSLCG